MNCAFELRFCLVLQEGMAIVSLIGRRMKATIGVAGATFTILAKNRMWGEVGVLGVVDVASCVGC